MVESEPASAADWSTCRLRAGISRLPYQPALSETTTASKRQAEL